MKSGIVAVVGRANAGKSTLVNVLVGEKVSIVSPKPQTTRDRILGVLTEADYQIVFADTPGLYKAESHLNALMQRTAEQSARDVDLILFVMDAHALILEEDFVAAKRFMRAKIPFVLVLSKIDIMPAERVPETLLQCGELGVDVVPVSARRGKNLKELLRVIVSRLPERGKIFEEDIVSDKSERFMLAELMREKILLINEFKEREDGGIVDVSLDIVCEKQNHKAILIGKQGKALKEVSSFAREEMEKFLGKKVFLTTYVKVEEHWRDSGRMIAELGYKDLEF